MDSVPGGTGWGSLLFPKMCNRAVYSLFGGRGGSLRGGCQGGVQKPKLRLRGGNPPNVTCQANSRAEAAEAKNNRRPTARPKLPRLRATDSHRQAGSRREAAGAKNNRRPTARPRLPKLKAKVSTYGKPRQGGQISLSERHFLRLRPETAKTEQTAPPAQACAPGGAKGKPSLPPRQRAGMSTWKGLWSNARNIAVAGQLKRQNYHPPE